MQEYYYIAWQTCWVIAAVITVCAFVFSDKDKTVKFLLAGWLFWALQFALLGAFSGAFISLFGFVRTFLAKKYENNHRTLWLMFFIIATISYFSYEWYLSLLPAIASFVATYALFRLQWTAFRMALIIPTSLWLIYNYSVWSIWWTIREIIILILHIKVILLSLAFAYKQEIYTLNYDTFVYLYNNSISKIFLLWKNFQNRLWIVSHPFSHKKKSLVSKISSN